MLGLRVIRVFPLVGNPRSDHVPAGKIKLDRFLRLWGVRCWQCGLRYNGDLMPRILFDELIIERGWLFHTVKEHTWGWACPRCAVTHRPGGQKDET